MEMTILADLLFWQHWKIIELNLITHALWNNIN